MDEKILCEVNGKVLLEAISKVKFAISKKWARYYEVDLYKYLWLASRSGGLDVMGCSGNQLALKQVDCVLYEDFELAIDLKNVAKIRKSNNYKFKINGNKLMLGDIEFDVYKQKLPDYRSFFNTTFKIQINLARNTLLQALEKVANKNKEGYYPVHMFVRPNECELIGLNGREEVACEAIVWEHAEKYFGLIINAEFLMHGLPKFDSEVVNLFFTHREGLIKVVGSKNDFIHFFMPMKYNS